MSESRPNTRLAPLQAQQQEIQHAHAVAQHIIDARFLLALVGVLAIALPLVLVLAALLAYIPFLQAWAVPLQAAISDYYHLQGWVRNAFVGTLCALAAIFLAYKGWSKTSYRLDRLLATACSFFAVVVAFFPSRHGPAASTSLHLSAHYIAAGALFIVLAFMALCRFTEDSGDENAPELRRIKTLRNGCYVLCASLMLLAMVGMLAVQILLPAGAQRYPYHVFVGESLALISFGLAWLIKSRSILGYDTDWPQRSWHALLRWLARPCWLCAWLGNAQQRYLPGAWRN